ncbi:hypothetical protein F6B43_15460 [Microbacterium rhizomatis]|uniref:DUF4232 domain-containing protein n=2 Tax=Microbacterium rhizomatis TaxID=1631477 RepID=A0A5J5IYE6_9MICO|nr:hypothetical protein F6B43_15460 [Microbacterium rhizomatis]
MLLLVIAVVVAAVWLLVAQPWRGTAAEQPASSPLPSRYSSITTGFPAPSAGATAAPSASPTPTASVAPVAEPTPTPAPTATEAVACTAGDVTVEALADHDTYASDQNPQLSIKLTNKSAKDCTINVGTSAQVFTITSGSDTWWRSTDCQNQPSDMVVLLTAGQSVTSATPLTWDRTRSSVDSCDSPDRSRAPGGGASYHLAVSIGGIPATQTASFMLY